jgi:hypothetical protein
LRVLAERMENEVSIPGNNSSPFCIHGTCISSYYA